LPQTHWQLFYRLTIRPTGDVSNSYQNLFAPAAFDFLNLGCDLYFIACSTLFQLGFFRGKETVLDNKSLDRIGIFFSISPLANAAWIFSWHYDQILLSLIWMLVILVCLIKINLIIKKMVLTKKEKFFIQIPFRVYFGWITVATIANVTTFLVSIHWNGVEFVRIESGPLLCPWRQSRVIGGSNFVEVPRI
jgi:hypothetical protein